MEKAETRRPTIRRAGAEIGGVVGQEGHDHREPHHVHEGGDEENQQAGHRPAIAASTSAISRGARESHSTPLGVTR